MPAQSSPRLLEELTSRTRSHLATAEAFLALPPETLHLRPRPDAWNALECLAHLNAYGEYYLQEIRRAIDASKYRDPAATYRPGWVGNWFANSMTPAIDMQKFPALRSMNPQHFTRASDEEAITEFIGQQRELLNLLEAAAEVDLTRTTTGISIIPLARLRLCDTLRVVIFHTWRHVVQAQRAVGEAAD